jgi:hypothetical protein
MVETKVESFLSLMTRHIRYLLCKDVTVILEEIGEHEFLFRVQVSPGVCDLSRVVEF